MTYSLLFFLFPLVIVQNNKMKMPNRVKFKCSMICILLSVFTTSKKKFTRVVHGARAQRCDSCYFFSVFIFGIEHWTQSCRVTYVQASTLASRLE